MVVCFRILLWFVLTHFSTITDYSCPLSAYFFPNTRASSEIPDLNSETGFVDSVCLLRRKNIQCCFSSFLDFQISFVLVFFSFPSRYVRSGLQNCNCLQKFTAVL